jgi:hypothetical protein
MTLNQSDHDFIISFNDRVDKLSSGRFTSWSADRSSGKGDPLMKTRIELGKSISVELFVPDDEALDAFFLNYRFFVQKKDYCIWKLPGIYSKLSDCREEKKHFNDYLKTIDDYLNSDSGFKDNGINWTNKQIMFCILYGSVAHENKDKKLIVDQWKSEAVHWVLIWGRFIEILEFVHEGILLFQELNESLLEDYSLWDLSPISVLH